MNWQIDPAHSSVGFAVKHMTVSTVRGRFGAIRGTIDLDPAAPERARADVTIDASSVDTGMPVRDQHLRSADFFDAERHPQITFLATAAHPLGGARFRIDGELTIRGVTRPLTLDAELVGVYESGRLGTRVGISATGKLDRTEFGLSRNQALEAGGWLVSDTVKLEIEVRPSRRPRPSRHSRVAGRLTFARMARILSLQLHERRCEPLRGVHEVRGRVGGGLVGDSHVEKRTRAVLVVDRSTLDALAVRPGDLREQITVDGLPSVTTLPAGTRLRVGGLTLEVNGTCEPCTHIGEMLEVEDREAFRELLVGRRGALCTVVAADGAAQRGDPVGVL